MSFTRFIKLQDVRQRFREEFQKPPFTEKPPLLAPPLTQHYALVGMAFSYLFQFHLKRLKPNAVMREWLAEKASSWVRDMKLYDKAKAILSDARKEYRKFLRRGELSDELIRSALRLAKLEIVTLHIGRGDENKVLDPEDPSDVEDLRKLISIVPWKKFRSRKRCILNPTFRTASSLMSGADADVLIDGLLLDLKTTKYAKLSEEYFHQLIGYYTLAGVDGVPRKHKITKLGLYFSRHALLYVFDIKDVVVPERFEKFVKWFERRAFRFSGDSFGAYLYREKHDKW